MHQGRSAPHAPVSGELRFCHRHADTIRRRVLEIMERYVAAHLVPGIKN